MSEDTKSGLNTFIPDFSVRNDNLKIEVHSNLSAAEFRAKFPDLYKFGDQVHRSIQDYCENADVDELIREGFRKRPDGSWRLPTYHEKERAHE